MPCKKPDNTQTPSRPSCVRRLDFGPDEPSAIQGDSVGSLEQLIAEEHRRARDVWNFDFENEMPLVGRWQWKRILVPLELAAREDGAKEDEEEAATEPEH